VNSTACTSCSKGVLLALLLISAPALAAGFPDSLVSKITDALPEAATISTSNEVVENYELLVGAAEKVGRELRASDTISLSGARTRTLWQLPAGAELNRTFTSATAQMVGAELFSCSGRDCGRSTAWANLVFSEALVYGQDRNQRYRVVRSSATQLAAIYAIRRGNQRVNLLLETILLDDASAATAATGSTTVGVAGGQVEGDGVVASLRQNGAVILSSVPGQEGELDAVATQALAEAGAALTEMPASTVYVVCHLYGDGPVESLLRLSLDCAASACAVLEDGYSEALAKRPSAAGESVPVDSKVSFRRFAAGPLLPRPLSPTVGPLSNRIELVRPGQSVQP